MLQEDNIVILSGNVGKTPEYAYTPKGTPNLKTTIAVTEKFGDKEETVWVNVELWGKTADLGKINISKGDRIRVFGKLNIRSWKGDDGKWQTWTKINVSRFEKLERLIFEEGATIQDYTSGFVGQLDEELEGAAPF